MLRLKGLVSLIILLVASGCSSDPQARKETLGGLTTMSAMGTAVVLMPVIPFTLGYAAISESKERKKDQQLFAQLDPVYKQRIEMIQARSPQADVAIVWNDGARAFLPFETNVIYHPGLTPEEYGPGLAGFNPQTNGSPLFTYLQTLLADDPLQKEVKIWNQPIRDFIHTRGEYEAAFNQEMFSRMQSEKAAAK